VVVYGEVGGQAVHTTALDGISSKSEHAVCYKSWVMRKILESLGFKPLLTQHIVTLMPHATYTLSAFLRIVLKCIMKTGCNAAV